MTAACFPIEKTNLKEPKEKTYVYLFTNNGQNKNRRGTPFNFEANACRRTSVDLWSLLDRQTGNHWCDVLLPVNSLSLKAQQILGKNGTKRFNNFLKYRAGWDGKDSKPLRKSSVAAMETFISKFSQSFDVTPSVFMSHEGNLLLGWEKHNTQVEIEFFANSVEYYIEYTDEAGEVDVKNLDIIDNLLFE